MLNRLDRAEWLSRLIRWMSTTLAAKRGLPVIAAIAMTVISLIVHVVWVISGSMVVGLCGFGLLHLAILIGFVGVLLAEPLGRG
ncbi:MAG: hypothetical protein KF726_14630 [Anaerolineae bacterium]|nr:hypothetical protein [Anaerolineae bacterium]